MPVSFGYDLDSCNIAGCEEPAGSLLLCDEHEKGYLVDSTVRDYQAAIARRARRDWTWRDKIRFGWAWLRHGATGKRIPLCEHFPLETVFLHNVKVLDRRTRQSELPPDVEQQIRCLLDDFQHRRNTLVSRLELIQSRVSGVPNQTSYQDMTEHVPGCLLPSPGQQVARFIFLGILAIALKLLEPTLGVEAPLLFGLDTLEFLMILPLFFALGYFGSRYLTSLHDLASRPPSYPWFNSAAHNADLRKSLKEAHARLREDTDKLAGSTGAFTAILWTSAVATWSNSALSNAIGVGFLLIVTFVLVPVLFTYPIFAETGLIPYSLMHRDVRIDVFRIDGSLGISDILDVELSTLSYNLALLALLILYIPLVYEGESTFLRVVYGLFIASHVLFRTHHILTAFRVLARLKRLARQRIDAAKEALQGNGSFAEERSRFEHLQGLRASPAGLQRVARAVEFFLASVALPVGIIWTNQNWDFLTKTVQHLILLLSG